MIRKEIYFSADCVQENPHVQNGDFFFHTPRDMDSPSRSRHKNNTWRDFRK